MWAGLFVSDEGVQEVKHLFVRNVLDTRANILAIAAKIAGETVTFVAPDDDVLRILETVFTQMEEQVSQRAEATSAKKKIRYLPDGSMTINRLIRRDGPECCWCGKETTMELGDLRATVEHILPASKGGIRSYRNLRVAHQKCNYERGDLPHHPRYALRPRPVPKWDDPPIPLRPKIVVITDDDWEPTIDGKVMITVAISGYKRRLCTIYVKGGGVQMMHKILNTGPDAVRAILDLHDRIPAPVTFAGLEALGFTYVPYMGRGQNGHVFQDGTEALLSNDPYP